MKNFQFSHNSSFFQNVVFKLWAVVKPHNVKVTGARIFAHPVKCWRCLFFWFFHILAISSKAKPSSRFSRQNLCHAVNCRFILISLSICSAVPSNEDNSITSIRLGHSFHLCVQQTIRSTPSGLCLCAKNDLLSYSNSIRTSSHRFEPTLRLAMQSGNPDCIDFKIKGVMEHTKKIDYTKFVYGSARKRFETNLVAKYTLTIASCHYPYLSDSAN